jgi:general secretion pathway protein G
LIAACIVVACRRERVEPIMSQALMTMRKAIDTYYAKQQHYPHALSDLVRDGELRTIPIDPVTHSSATWRPTFSEKVRVDDFTSGAPAPPPAPSEIIDVHSGASGKDSNGRAWSDY